MTILYVARLLSDRYLLEGKLNQLKSDQSVKVLVKALAIECITSLITLSPNLLCMKLYKENDNDLVKQYLHDIMLYRTHQDDKMRINISLLIGNMINSILIQYNGDYDLFINSNENNKGS